tara:strand:+ start:15878 stop:16468 length:591 start_codon:yes stop_codon:yes gene_type:complete
MHGGSSPRGPSHPSFKHGRQSAWLKTLGIEPPDPNDASMLDVRAGVMIQQKVIERVSQRMAENDSPAYRAECRRRFRALKDALFAKEPDLIQKALREMDSWLTRGQREDDSLKQLSDSAYKLSNQVEGAHRARTNTLNALNKADALTFMSEVVRMVREEAGVDAATRVFARANRELLAGRIDVAAPEVGPEQPSGE